MVHADEADAEATDVYDISLHHGMQVARINSGLFQASLEYAERQARAIDRHIDMLQHIGQRSYMVLVPVCQHDGLYLVSILEQISDIGDYEIHPEHILFRKHKSGIYNQYLIIHADDCHVLADLPETAQGDDLQFLLSFRQRKYTSINI